MVLVPRNVEGAVIHDTKHAIDRVVRMVKEGTVETLTGEVIHINRFYMCTWGQSKSNRVCQRNKKAF